MKTLTDALSALKKATAAEGVVSMNAEALTSYATEQVEKMTADPDQGAARRAHLAGVIEDALDVYKADPTAEAEFVPYAEPEVEPEATEAKLDPNVASLADSVAKLTAMMAKQAPAEAVAPTVDNEAGNPTSDEFHPPPVPEGAGVTPDEPGSSVATNNPQGDDGTPRADLTKGLDSDTAASGGVTIEPEDDPEFNDDAFVWAGDMNSELGRKDVAKNGDANRPTWGFDNEPVPSSLPSR